MTAFAPGTRSFHDYISGDCSVCSQPSRASSTRERDSPGGGTPASPPSLKYLPSPAERRPWAPRSATDRLGGLDTQPRDKFCICIMGITRGC